MKYFNRKEFSCKCGCGFDSVDYELVSILEELREHYNSPVIVSSSARCLEHNRSIGSTDKSQHTKGRAADITVKGVTPMAVHTYLNEKYPDQYGLGFYNTFTHIDTRKGKARWS